MLRIENVGKSFGALNVLRGVNLEAATGQITGVIGPNGAGKSTLLNVVGGIYANNTGRILLDGEDLTPLSVHARAQLGLVRTFQISRELGELTVLENLMLARKGQTGESVLNALLRYRSVQEEERAAIATAKRHLENVGLWRLANESARALSGGQKKLLELSRALMLEPKIILLDEPAAGVSPPMRVEISNVIRGLRDQGMTFVIVEHDMDMIASLCDRVYVMAEGENLTSGTFKQVVADDRVVRAYLGGVA